MAYFEKAGTGTGRPLRSNPAPHHYRQSPSTTKKLTEKSSWSCFLVIVPPFSPARNLAKILTKSCCRICVHLTGRLRHFLGPGNFFVNHYNCVSWKSRNELLEVNLFGKSSSHNNDNRLPVLWIRIRIGSVFRSFPDPDPFSEYESGFTHVRLKYQ